MSYSFSVVRAVKSDLVVAIGDELNKVVASQPVHEADAGKALEYASGLLFMMENDPACDLSASVSGSIWKTDAGIQSLSLNINLGYVAKAAVEEEPPLAEESGKSPLDESELIDQKTE